MNETLPYLNTKFFISIFFGVLALNVLIRTPIPFKWYKRFFFGLTFINLIFLFPNPAALLFLFICFYTLYLFVYRFNGKFTQAICIVLTVIPIVCIKLDVSPLMNLVGVSYLVFRMIQMLAESNYSKKLNAIDTFNFLFFPPSLLAGPIDHSVRFTKEIDSHLELRSWPILSGWESFILGVSYKFIICAFIQKYLIMEVDFKSPLLLDILKAMYSYTLYFFFDLAGYSAMAIGIGKMIGINLPRNFNLPFIALNPVDFWKRFHISLGTWLGDYVFKPFYKALKKIHFLRNHKLLSQNIALFSTFLVMGFWNGFQLNYIISGGLFGVFSVTHHSYKILLGGKRYDLFTLLPDVISANLKRFLMFHAASFSLYIFNGQFPIF